MTGFALGDKFIGVSTDNIYTKQELDTKLQDKQDTLTAGQGININEDGTISVDVTSAGFGLGAQAPLQYTSAQYATSVEINKEAGTFTRKLTLPSTSARETPYKGQHLNNNKWHLTGTYNSDNQTVTIDTAQTLYAECPTTSNVTFRFDPPFNNDTTSGSRACVIFGYKDENGNITHLGNVTYTVSTTTHTLHGGYQTVSSLVSKGGIYTQESNGISEMILSFDQHLEELQVSQIPTENFYIILRAYRQGSTGNQMYYICFKDATTDETIYNEGFMVSEQMPDLNFFCLSTTDDIAYPITGRARVVGDDRPNEYVWTVKDGVSPNTLKLNYDGSLTLDSSNNLKVNVENLGLATVATTGSYMDLTNTPEEYVLPTASTDTLGGVKVDGTSIVIADGVISTNTGTGVDTYTKVEVNNLLSAKQDTITPSSPLSITKEVRSNLEGFQYTTDSTGVYTTGNYYWSSWAAPYQFFKSNNDLPGTTLNPQTFTNKIIIPYTFGQVVKLPSNREYSPFCFGKILNDGTFIPIYQPILNSRYIVMSDIPITYGGTYNNLIQMSPTDTGKQSPDTSEQLASDADYLTYTLIQMLLDDTDGSLSTNIMNYSTYTASQGSPYKGQYSFTQANYVNRLKEINCIIIAPTTSCGRDVNTAIPIVDIALYANPGNLYNLITSENYNNIDLGENLFDLSGEQAYNYLDLSIGAGLSISDGVLVNNNPTPYELPTASVETLGGVKVDGTSIVISDGVISTNTGTEVDTYTKGEVDILLAKKEDNITATQPLALEQKTSNTGSVGFTVSESNTLMPSSDAISLNMNTQNSGTMQSSFNNYIVIPYSYSEKTVVRIPCNSSEPPSNSTSAFLGYLDDGVVQPLVYFPICWSTNNASTNYVYTMDINNPNASTGTHPNNTAGSYNADGLIEGKYYSYLTTYYSPDWTQYGLTSYTKSGTTDDKDIICFQRYNFDSTEEKAAIEKVNCIVISYGVSLNQFPIDLKICGKFPYKGDFATGAIPYDAPLDDVADLTNNILDFTTVTVNELSLNIDNSTIKVNDNGQLYANIELPDNVLTSSNIRQDAYIQQLEARVAALEALIDGGNSSGTSLNLSPTPAPQVNNALSEAGYVGVDTVTVEDGE